MRSSPADTPASCSSKPGMKRLEPITISASSAEPPSKVSPSMRPVKSASTMSPSAAAPSLASKARLAPAISAIWLSISSSVAA